MDNTSGQGKLAEVPEGIKGWSWGAFFLSWIWGLGNKTYLALLCFIPFVGFLMIVVLGFKGREWAWRNKHWEDVEHFNRVQRKWSAWGLGLVLGTAVLGILAAIFIPILAPHTVISTTPHSYPSPREDQAVITPDVLYQDGLAMHEKGLFSSAALRWERLLQNNPDSPHAQDAEYYLALDQLKLGNVRGAYVTYSEARVRHPSNNKLARIAHDLLEAYGKNPRSSGLRSPELSDLLRQCEGGEVPSVLLERANELFEHKDYADSRIYYERIISSYQAGEHEPLVFFRRAECYYFQQKWRDAENVYVTFVHNFPKDDHVSLAQSRLAECRKKMG